MSRIIVLGVLFAAGLATSGCASWRPAGGPTAPVTQQDSGKYGL